MPMTPVQPDDPRLDAFANLRDRDLRREGRIIAEGRWLVQRLIRAGLPQTKVLTTRRFADEMSDFAERGGEVLLADEDVISRVAGFHFHRGVMATALRPAPLSLDDAMNQTNAGEMIVVLPDAALAENIGSIFRTAAALGVRLALLGPECGDEYSRRAVRVSMGAALTLPIVRSANLPTDLNKLKREGYRLVAAVLDDAAEKLTNIAPGAPTAVLLGSEAMGLKPEIIALADQKATIPMAGNTDSLNLAAAAAIMLHHFRCL